MRELFYRLLLRLAGALMTSYLMPLLNPPVRAALETVLPIAKRWVYAFAKTSDPGAKKRELATKQIWIELERAKAKGVTRADVDTAIQLAYHQLGLDADKRTTT